MVERWHESKGENLTAVSHPRDGTGLLKVRSVKLDFYDQDQMANLVPFEHSEIKQTWSHCKRHTHLYHTAYEKGQEDVFGNAKAKIYLTKPDGSGGLFVLAVQPVLCFQSVWEERLK